MPKEGFVQHIELIGTIHKPVNIFRFLLAFVLLFAVLALQAFNIFLVATSDYFVGASILYWGFVILFLLVTLFLFVFIVFCIIQYFRHRNR